MSALLDQVRDQIAEREQALEAARTALEHLRAMEQHALALNGDARGGAGSADQAPRTRARSETPAPPRASRTAPRAEHPPSGGRRSPRAKPAADSRAETIVRALGDGPLASGELSLAAGLGTAGTSGALSDAVRPLLEHGIIGREGNGGRGGYRYFLTAAKDAEVAQRNGTPPPGRSPWPERRRRILDAITADPGALNEERLAQTLDADREDIALACGELLEADHVEMRPDGTYTIAPRATNGGGSAEPWTPRRSSS